MNALEIKNLKASYDKRQVLNGISMLVKSGETFGIVGLNGAGKTTMIKTILGLKDEDSGDILIQSHDKRDAKVKSSVSYLPERFDPPWFLKGGEFVHFSANLYGRKLVRSEIEDYCNKLALDPAVLDKKVQTYSKGMRQKLGLIATILTGTPILILDEPMSGLDPLARALVKDALQAVKNQGRTVILSSHILADMDEICNTIAIIHGGNLHFQGIPQQFKAQMNESSLERAFLGLIRADDRKVA